MFATDDTIVAIATPPGRGAIGVVRLSGPRAREVAGAITTSTSFAPRHATLTRVRTPQQSASAHAVDRVVATYFPQPHSYTGQDVVELSAHGSPVVLQTIMRLAVDAGARLARAGEFTLRAFLAARIDLVQAEAVADLIASATPLQARAAFDQLEGTLTSKIAALDAELFDLIAKLEASLDFPDEGYHFIEADEARTRVTQLLAGIDALLGDAGRGRLIREGAVVVLAGRPNVGKSSLFNALVGADRAIVTEVPGTTRDLITETVDVNGFAVTLVDTAGAREAVDVIEREGVRRGRDARNIAGLIVIIIDGSAPVTPDDEALLTETAQQRRLIVANKSDLPAAVSIEGATQVSGLTGQGMDLLRCAIARELAGDESSRDVPLVTNLRHIALLGDTRECLDRALAGLGEGGVSEEFVLPDLQAARARLDDIVGVRTSDDVLNHIFATFCIGK